MTNHLKMMMTLIVGAMSSVATGQTWIEAGDAGSLPNDTQIADGVGPLNLIVGSTSAGDLEDMYLILIDDPINFEATTDNGIIPGAMADFDTQLFLFDADLGGLGVLANDDCFFGCPNNRSHLFSPATDGTNQDITHPGLYFLAITGFDNDPQSGAGPMFNQVQFNEVSGPDGPGGNQQIGGWSGGGDFGDYAIGLIGAQFVQTGYDCFGSTCQLVPFGPLPTLGDCAALCCDDGDLCTVDFADPETGACQNAPLDCDDGNGWTIDACDPGIGCVNELPPPAPFEPGTKHTPPAVPCETGTCPSEGDESLGIDPVYAFSGEFYMQDVDLHIPGRGFDFVWGRKYRAQLGPVTAMGNGWDFSYNLAVEPCGADFVLRNGNSRFDFFEPQGDGTWTSPQFFHVITQNPDSTLTVTLPDNATWNFHAIDGGTTSGKLDSIVDRNGNAMTFTYDGGGRLDVIVDTLGRSIDVAYNADGFIDAVTDFAGRAVTYDYYEDGDAGGAAGDLKSVTSPPVVDTPQFPAPPGHAFPSGKTTTYTYTTGFADERLNHDLLTITDPKGQTYLQNIYAHTIDVGDARHTQDPAHFNFDRLVSQVWGDPDDRVDLFYLPVVPDETANNNAEIRVIVNDRVGNVREYFYDGANTGVMQREYTGRADADLPTTDTDNRPTGKLRVTDPDFFETRWEYNADALVTHIIHPELNEETFIYDDANVDRRAQGNLRFHIRTPGPRGGDQPSIVEEFEYEGGFGGCCGANFVSRHVDGRGNETVHEYDANGNRERTTHRIPSIVEDFEYNAFGQLTAHDHPDNGSGHRRRDEYKYYTSGPQTGYREQLIVDVNNLALTTTYEYNAVGSLVRVIDPRGGDTLYTVNVLDQVILETSEEVESGGGIRYQTERFYDANDNLVRVDVDNVDDDGVTQPNTHYTTIYEYEILDQVERTCREVGALDVGVGVFECAGLDGDELIITEFEYDANRNRVLERQGAAVDGSDPDNVIKTLYDERDLVFERIAAPDAAIQSTTRLDYDGNGNTVRAQSGVEDDPRTTVTEYDGYDRAIRVVDPMGNETEAHYDANGNIGGDQSPGVPNPFGRRVSGEAVDVPGSAGNGVMHEMRHVYDAMDRLRFQYDLHFDAVTLLPIGDGESETVYEYNDASQEVLATDDNGHQIVTTYDTALRIHTVTDPRGNVETYTYDANSNVATVTELERSDVSSPALDETFVTTFGYDGLDRLVTTTDNIGTVAEQRYDSRGNATRRVDGEGHVVRMEYDGVDRVVRTIYDLDDDGADGDGDDITTVRVHDDSSRLVAEVDGEGHVTRYAFDSLDRLIVTRWADGTLEQNGTGLLPTAWPAGQAAPDLTGFVSGYDVHGNAELRVDAGGTTVTTVYDLLDRVVERTIAVGVNVSDTTTTETFEYDGLSRIVRAEDDDDVVERAYDSLSNVLVETLNGQSVVSTYDGVGNQETCAYPGGRVVTCAYDPLDRKQTISDQQGTIATYDFIGAHRVERREYGNGTRLDYVYDGILPNPVDDFGVRHVVGTLHTRIADGVVLDTRTYRWDRAHNKTRRRDERADGPLWIHDYAYDAIYRLRFSTVRDAAEAPVRTAEFRFDDAGNRSEVLGVPFPGLYDLDATMPQPADDQLNQYTTTPFDTREYDARGNLVAVTALRLYADANIDGVVDVNDVSCVLAEYAGASSACGSNAVDLQPCGGDGQVDLDDILGAIDAALGAPTCADIIDISTLTYDYRNRMVEFVDVTGGERHEYDYDPMNRRVRRVVDADGAAEETRYYYDGWQVIEERDGADQVEATYVYGIYVDEVLTMQRAGVDLYYHGDDMHNVMALSDAAGDVVERYEYDSYGRTVNADTLVPAAEPAATTDNPYLFNGRRWDVESALYYYRTRYLDPQSGRFTTRDTLGLWGDPLNMGNGYAYAGNNPWSVIDPTGQLSVKCFIMCMLGLDSTDVDALLRAGLGKIADDIKDGALNRAARRVAAAGARLARRLGKKKAARLIAKLGAKLVPGVGTASTIASACYCGWKCW